MGDRLKNKDAGFRQNLCKKATSALKLQFIRIQSLIKTLPFFYPTQSQHATMATQAMHCVPLVRDQPI
jgi:hypothetical protein